MKLIIISGLIVVSLLNGCATGPDFDARLSPIVSPHRFSITGWEWQIVVSHAKQWFSGFPIKEAEINDEIGVVTGYFDANKRIRILQSEIAAADARSGGSAPFQLEDE